MGITRCYKTDRTSRRRRLIEKAEQNNIHFQYSWGTQKIQQYLESDMRIDKVVTVNCALTGLPFKIKVQNIRKGAYHPRISEQLRLLSTRKRVRAKDRIDDGQCNSLEGALSIIADVAKVRGYREIKKFHFYGTSVTRFYLKHGLVVEETPQKIEPENERPYFDICQPGLYRAKQKFSNGYEIEYFYRLNRAIQNNTNFEIRKRDFEQLLNEMIESAVAPQAA